MIRHLCLHLVPERHDSSFLYFCVYFTLPLFNILPSPLCTYVLIYASLFLSYHATFCVYHWLCLQTLMLLSSFSSFPFILYLLSSTFFAPFQPFTFFFLLPCSSLLLCAPMWRGGENTCVMTEMTTGITMAPVC